MAKVRTSRVLARYGVWVVTVWGIENEQRYYPIQKKRVHELDWEKHLQMKRWMDGAQLLDFAMALDDARQRFPKKARQPAQMAGGVQ